MQSDPDSEAVTEDDASAPPVSPAEESPSGDQAPSAIDPAALSRLAHDLRSPLTVLVCNLRFLQDLLAEGPDVDPEVKEILEDDAAALARLDELVASLGALAKGKRG